MYDQTSPYFTTRAVMNDADTAFIAHYMKCGKFEECATCKNLKKAHRKAERAHHAIVKAGG